MLKILQVVSLESECLKDVSLCVNVRNLVHLSLEADPVTVADSLLDQQYPSGWGDGLELNSELLALGLL